jgi:hypothetical protein
MIDSVLGYLQEQLNAYLLPPNSPAGGEDRVGFPTDEPADSVQLPLNQVVPLLIRIEEEKTARLDDRYLRVQKRNVQDPDSKNNLLYTIAPPAVPLHLYVLFIARYKNYLEGARRLSQVIRFFQAHPTLQPPSLPELTTELHTPSFTALNEIWSALKLPLHPAALYKITMLLVEDTAAGDTPATVRQIAPAREKLPHQTSVTDDSPVKTTVIHPLSLD